MSYQKNAREILSKVEEPYIRNDLQDFQIGDSVKIHLKIIEEKSHRIQIFAGTVIARKRKDLSATFTVRKISFGIAIERIFPLHSPFIDKIEVISSHHVRRAKLYFLRNKFGKAAKLKLKKEVKKKSKNPSEQR